MGTTKRTARLARLAARITTTDGALGLDWIAMREDGRRMVCEALPRGSRVRGLHVRPSGLYAADVSRDGGASWVEWLSDILPVVAA